MVRGIPMKACVEKAVEFLSGAIHDAVEEGTDRNERRSVLKNIWGY